DQAGQTEALPEGRDVSVVHAQVSGP
ncbi:MAG: hypothetical protein JWN55_1469, partial [Frankiales bacterium]|nr:hypothetical protein [Frankiales bacterium]